MALPVYGWGLMQLVNWVFSAGKFADDGGDQKGRYEGMGYLGTKVPYDYHHRYYLYLKKLVSPMRDISTRELAQDTDV